jgi:hypothetical protein
VLSDAGNFDSEKRTCLLPATLQASVLLRSWWKHNVLGFDSVISISLAGDGSQTEVEDEDRAALDLQEYISSVCGD